MTRRSILDSALQVFSESGYRSGSLRSVADRAHISEAGLLHHFPSKSALLSAVLQRRDEQTQQRWKENAARGIGVMQSLVELAEYNASTPGIVELFTTLSAEATSPAHPAHPYFAERYRTSIESLCASFEALRSAGRLRPGVDPLSAAKSVIALMDGLQIQWLLNRGATDMAARLREHLEGMIVGELPSLADVAG